MGPSVLMIRSSKPNMPRSPIDNALETLTTPYCESGTTRPEGVKTGVLGVGQTLENVHVHCSGLEAGAATICKQLAPRTERMTMEMRILLLNNLLFISFHLTDVGYFLSLRPSSALPRAIEIIDLETGL